MKLEKAPLEGYPGNGGAFGLVNGLTSEKGITSPEWLGWRGDDMEATIDLGKSQSLSNVGIHALNRGGSRVYSPVELQVSFSVDGKTFSSLGSTDKFTQDASETSGFMNVKFDPTNARFVKVVAKNYAKIPEGKTGAGDPALMLIDEIIVE